MTMSFLSHHIGSVDDVAKLLKLFMNHDGDLVTILLSLNVSNTLYRSGWRVRTGCNGCSILIGFEMNQQFNIFQMYFLAN